MTRYTVRLQTSLLNGLKKFVEEDGITVAHFINVAVAEKLNMVYGERYFQERAAKGDPETFLAILEKAGSMEPIEGDELPPGYSRE